MNSRATQKHIYLAILIGSDYIVIKYLTFSYTWQFIILHKLKSLLGYIAFLFVPISATGDSIHINLYTGLQFNDNVTSLNENGASGDAKITLKEGATSWAEPLLGIEISKEIYRIEQVSFELFGDARYRRFGYRSDGINYVKGSTNINFVDTTNISISSSEASFGGTLKYNISESLNATASVALSVQSQDVNTKFGSWNMTDRLLINGVISRAGFEYELGVEPLLGDKPMKIYCGAFSDAAQTVAECNVGVFFRY